MSTVLLQLFGAIYALLLPGILAAFLLDAEWSLPVRVAVGAMLGALIVPTVCFCVAWIAGTSITLLLVVLVSTGLNLLLGASVLLRRIRAARTGGA